MTENVTTEYREILAEICTELSPSRKAPTSARTPTCWATWRSIRSR